MVPNPLSGQAGQPQLLLRENVNLAAATYGGLITGMRRNGTRITTGPLRAILRPCQAPTHPDPQTRAAGPARASLGPATATSARPV